MKYLLAAWKKDKYLRVKICFNKAPEHILLVKWNYHSYQFQSFRHCCYGFCMSLVCSGSFKLSLARSLKLTFLGCREESKVCLCFRSWEIIGPRSFLKPAPIIQLSTSPSTKTCLLTRKTNTDLEKIIFQILYFDMEDLCHNTRSILDSLSRYLPQCLFYFNPILIASECDKKKKLVALQNGR